MRARHMLAAVLALLPTVASASETVTYSYDAKGRLINVQHTGGPVGGTAVAYAYDPADNRSSVTVAGALAQLVIVPLNGLSIIPFTGS